MLYLGTSPFGRVDEVPNQFYVATAFFHIYGFPLIPIRSYLVDWKAVPDSFGRPIPFSGKSILIAWFRALMIAVPIFAAITAVALYGDRSVGARSWRYGTASAAILALFLLVFAYAPALRRASPERARELASMLGLTPDALWKTDEEASNQRKSASEENSRQTIEPPRDDRRTKNRWREVPPGPSS